MIGPRGIINKNSSDYPAQEPRRNQSKRRNDAPPEQRQQHNQGYNLNEPALRRADHDGDHRRRQAVAAAIKVIIDEGGTMRAIPLV
jgi:hypothetical protein